MSPPRSRVRPGDVVEVKTPRGLAYLQYTARHPDFGDTVRVLPGLHDSRPREWTAQPEPSEYFAFYPVEAALRQGLVEIVGKRPIPEGQALPPALRRPGARSQDGRVLGWLVWNGENEVLKPELSHAERQLPIGAIWNHELLVLRLTAQWHPAQERTSSRRRSPPPEPN